MNVINVGPGPTPGHYVAVLWAVVAIDEEGNEGIAGMLTSTGWMPLVVSEKRLVPKLRKAARKGAPGVTLELREFREWIP